MIKKLTLAIISIILILITGVLGTLFFRPSLIINPKVLSFGLHKVPDLKTWNWKMASFTHEWKQWNERYFSGYIDDFCLYYQSEAMSVNSCFEKISWDVGLYFSISEGLKLTTVKPFYVRSSFVHFKMSPAEKEESPGNPPDIYAYWKLFWSDLVPDMDMSFQEIRIKEIKTDLRILKTRKHFSANSMGFELEAQPESFILRAPKKYPLPKKLPLAVDPVHFLDVTLRGKVSEQGIPMNLNGRLESLLFEVTSFIALPLKGDFTSIPFLKDFLLQTNGKVVLNNVKETLKKYGPAPYTQLPAPFNVMNGSIVTTLSSKKTDDDNVIAFESITNIDLKSDKQSLVLDLASDLPINLKTLKPSTVGVSIDFKNVLIQLPRFSKKSPPPQFVPDGRFKQKVTLDKIEKKKSLPVLLEIGSTAKNPLQIRTNLLDELLRLHFNFKIAKGKLEEGFLKILPLKTTVFKRPIRLTEFLMNFNTDEPVLYAKINFPLPEYKITLNLEGPVSNPRYSFESKPPLPQNDIYAVLLFGRPLADLNPDDKTAAQQTNQLLSQGILSLSVLYFLAGSPVEYIGYDPGSKNATAQFGLGSKSSLRIGGGQEGVNSTAIRRSLGKGWYLDTSVQNASKRNAGGPNNSRNYGVLLERVISY